MHEIVVPQINANDESCVLLAWTVGDGHDVEGSAPVAVLETAKTTIEVESGERGVLHHAVPVGAEVRVGDVIAYVFDTHDARAQFVNAASARAVEAAAPNVTRAARELMEAHGVPEAELAGLGKAVVRRTDVEQWLERRRREQAPPPAPAAAARSVPLSRHQAAVARTVSESHATIPRAYLAMKVYCDPAFELLQREMARDGVVLGLTELLVKSVAAQFDRYPACFGHWAEPGECVLAPAPNIGVTLDVGNGLYIPAVPDPRTSSLRTVADQLLAFKLKAVRRAFDDEDLAGGSLTISLNPEKDVLAVLPIVLPGQACMLAVGSVQEEWTVRSGAPVTRRWIQVGMAYDHRLINGNDAVQFLKSVKDMLESPGPELS